MPLADLPTGTVAAPSSVGSSTGSRVARFSYALLNANDEQIDELDGVSGGSLEWSAAASIKGSGTINLTERGQEIDWLTHRIGVTYHANGLEWPLGVYVPAAPTLTHTATSRTRAIECYDKTSLLARDVPSDWVTYDAGTVVTDAVKEVIEGAGLSSQGVVDYPATLTSAKSWVPDDENEPASRLRIINDLLDAAGFFALGVSGSGRFFVQPWASPSNRPVAYAFADGEASIYTNDFTREQDIWRIPNSVLVISQGDGETEALTALAENNDPNSPWSIPNRGVVSHVETGVDITSQEALDTYAQRRLSERSSVAATITILHAPISLRPSDVVTFRHSPTGIDGRFVVQNTTVTLDPTALQSTVLREVVS